jgi:hypothetical protein
MNEHAKPLTLSERAGRAHVARADVADAFFVGGWWLSPLVPAKAGTQFANSSLRVLDSRLRRSERFFNGFALIPAKAGIQYCGSMN